MGIAAILEKLYMLRLRKLVLFFVLCALTVAYVEVFYNRSLSQVDATQQKRVGNLVAKYSKQNKKSFLSKVNIKHDLKSREIYTTNTSANMRKGLSSKSETKQTLTDLMNPTEQTLQRKNFTLPAEIEQVRVKEKEAKQNKIEEGSYNEIKDKFRTKWHEKGTRASAQHWKHRSALHRIPFARHLQLEPSFQRNGYHGTDLMALVSQIVWGPNRYLVADLGIKHVAFKVGFKFLFICDFCIPIHRRRKRGARGARPPPII